MILLIGATSFTTKQLNLGLDLSREQPGHGGLERDASVEDVRSTLEGIGINDAEITEASSDQLGPNVIQIDSEIEPEKVQRSSRRSTAPSGSFPTASSPPPLGRPSASRWRGARSTRWSSRCW